MDFISWKEREIHDGQFFISDGIINEKAWEKAPVKVLFLMKEAYESSPDVIDEWALNDYLASKRLSELGKSMWWSMAQWVDGINKLIETGEVIQFDEGYKSNPKLEEAFQSCAVINIKKSSGKSSSTNEDLFAYVNSDWDLLWQQIQSINPDLIICGATYPLIESKLEKSDKSAEWLYHAKGYYFVDFWHPSNQWPYKVKYYSLMSALKQSKTLWKPR
ncbi:hypothetical protein [Shewanella aquimarina]|uniref:hypothetical protein n=1 Tax=Shewanella aquimarina TaxID=260365 RepID=UPI002014A8BD|nr:hypothetical protein [Shewanella aquimarina]MCL2909121.1 hypothetical protein [Shewanella aquimarina]